MRIQLYKSTAIISSRRHIGVVIHSGLPTSYRLETILNTFTK